MRLTGILLLLLGMCGYVQAQDAPAAPADSLPKWKRTITLSASASQTTLSDNWKGGGTSLLALNNVLLATFQREGRHFVFNQTTDLQFGLVRNQGQEPRKTTDRIFVDAVGGYKLTDKWHLTGSANFLSQFAPGYDYPKAGDPSPRRLVSRFMAPAYLVEAIGFEYKPVSWFNVRFGVGGLRHTFVIDTTLYRQVPKNYGVPVGDVSRTQAVFQLLADLERDIAKNIHLKSRYLATVDYEQINGRGLVQRLDVVITARVNRWLATTASATAILDKDQSPRVQYQHILGIGLNVKL